MLVGGGGRESAFARALASDSIVSAVLPHPNPSILRRVHTSGGQHYLGNVCSKNLVTQSAYDAKVDYVFVNADNPLEAGIVDCLLEAGIQAIGPTREGARIEWDKIYANTLVQKLFPNHVPYSHVVDSSQECERALEQFKERGLQVVVKPRGLTGGKGVKVMGEHLDNYREALDYAKTLLAEEDASVLLSEKIFGHEFTIMAITDGQDAVFAPATYDYPYRYEGDTGLGTGGMGCFTDTKHQLPFMSAAEYGTCQKIMQSIIEHLHQSKIHFNGVLNGGFFVTQTGDIRFMEFNSRFGDPEVMNVLALLDGSFAAVLEALYHRDLKNQMPRFLPKASMVKYLVSPEYPQKPPADAPHMEFDMNIEKIEAESVHVDCASMVETNTPQRYRALPGSRTVAVSCVEDSISSASERLNEIIERHMGGTGLEYRKDIGAAKEVAAMRSVLATR